MKGRTGLWIGSIWIGLGIFLLIANWLDRAAYPIPGTNIELGWLVLVLGIFRIWWWWKSVEQPRRRRLAFDAERRQREKERLYAGENPQEENAEGDWLTEDGKPSPDKS